MNATRTQEDFSGGFEPRMRIEAVKEQASGYPWLPEALAKCGAGRWESPAYAGYVSCPNPNQAGSEWQFEANVVLNHQTLGMLVIDVLKNSRLGGIEFVDRIDG
jgi:hypothetical protein